MSSRTHFSGGFWGVLGALIALGCNQSASDVSLSRSIDVGMDSSVEPTIESILDSEVDAISMPLSACEMSDVDGDSYGTDDSCDIRDCNDNFPSINPGSFEACNGKDDDCDGIIDEGLADAVCGVGQCRNRQASCVDGVRQACTPYEPETEICNGEDDDCDGVIDEHLLLISCGQGACTQTQVCDDGVLNACVPLEHTDETCDRIDNDCDGRVDEGFGANMERVAYEELSEIQAGCSGFNWSGLAGPDCDSAIHRYCANIGCHKTGYGPAENSNGYAWITCLNDASLVNTTYTRLNEFHSVCAADGERQGMNCNAAISRFCNSEGFITGFGPVEQEGLTAVVGCVGSPAHHHEVTYSALSEFHTPCDGTQRIGPNCNAAIKRYCVSIGYRSGFGPNENYGDYAMVTCVE